MLDLKKLIEYGDYITSNYKFYNEQAHQTVDRFFVQIMEEIFEAQIEFEYYLKFNSRMLPLEEGELTEKDVLKSYAYELADICLYISSFMAELRNKYYKPEDDDFYKLGELKDNLLAYESIKLRCQQGNIVDLLGRDLYRIRTMYKRRKYHKNHKPIEFEGDKDVVIALKDTFALLKMMLLKVNYIYIHTVVGEDIGGNLQDIIDNKFKKFISINNID